MSEHVLSDEELRIPEHPDRPSMGWMSIELDAIKRYGNAAYQLGIEREKREARAAIAAQVGQDSLESQDFYELMQAYRHSAYGAMETTKAFEAVKEHIRTQATNEALERAAKACDDALTYEPDDPGEGFAKVIRKMKVAP